MAAEKEFLEAYDKYGTQILRHISFRVSDDRVAQDIFQETFLKAWKYLGEKNEVGNLRALLYAIAKNLIIDFYRQKSRTDIPLEDLGANEPFVDELEGEVSDLGEIEKVKAAIESLGADDEKAAIYLKYVDELSTREIAELLDKTPSNVRVIIHRGLAKIRKKLYVE